MTMKAIMKLAPLLLVLSLVACGDDTTIYELEVIETISMPPEKMVGGVASVSETDLDDLRTEEKYAAIVEHLRCGAFDAASSYLTVERLTVGAGATALDYQVAVAARGTSNYVPLARFSGSITNGDRIDFTNNRVTLDSAGIQRIAQTILSTTPALSVRISATVPGALDELQIAVSLSLFFSSDAGACPSTTTGF